MESREGLYCIEVQWEEMNQEGVGERQKLNYHEHNYCCVYIPFFNEMHIPTISLIRYTHFNRITLIEVRYGNVQLFIDLIHPALLVQ